MPSGTVNMLIVGDIIVGNHADSYFEHVRPLFKASDFVMGHLEVPYSLNHPQSGELERDPDNIWPIVSAGFDVLTIAGNHLYDFGVVGIEDTISWLKKHKIACPGAGMNIEEARRPVIVNHNGANIGVLKYNCVGPKETWASGDKPGGAYVHILTHYELEHANPGGPPAVYTRAEPKSLRAMEEDIHKLRPLCDILVVSFHKGLVHQPAKIADYERQISHKAIDAGADLIVGEHAHLLKGIEIYKEKLIFHGLCNIVAYVPSLFPKPGEDTGAWSNKRIELFGFEPNREYPTYPFHPEAIYTIIAKCQAENGKITKTGFVPCIVNKNGQPVVVEKDIGGQIVVDYMDKITRKAKLNARFRWEGDEVIIFKGIDEESPQTSG